MRAKHVPRLSLLCAPVLVAVLLVALGPSGVVQAAPFPLFEVRPFESAVYMWGQEWAPNSEVLIEIDDPSTAEAVDFSTTAGTDANGFFELLDIPFAVAAGNAITLSQGATVKTHVVVDLTVTRVGLVSDTVSGVGAPNTETFVGVNVNDQEGSQRTVLSDAAGAWTADFSVPGPGGEPAFDVGPDVSVYTNQHDDDWDMTGITYRYQPPQGRRHNPATGHDYSYVENGMSWADAEAYAVSLGGHLVTINDAAEDAWLVEAFGTEYWVGFNDTDTEGVWVWVSGEPVTFTNWQAGEPNDAPSGEDAAVVWSTATVGWSDFRVDLALPFVVELSPEPVAEPGFVASVPLPTTISGDPEVIGTNFVLALIFTAILAFTSTLFNNTLKSKNAEIVAAVGRLKAVIPRVAWPRKLQLGLSRLRRRWIESLAIVFVTGLVYAFLDPGFGFSAHGLLIFVSLAVSLAVVTYSYEGVQALASSRGYHVPARLRLFPVAIVIAIICVIISRVSGFTPGYLYGFVGGLAFLGAGEPDDRTKGRLVLLAAACLLVVSLVAWFLAWPLTNAVSAGSSSLEVIQGICVATFVAGMEGLVFGLIPLSFMDGATLFRWNKWVWGGVFAVPVFLFWHVLLNKHSKYGAALEQTSAKVVTGLLAFWVVATVGTYWYFRKPRGKADELPAGHDGSKPA